LRIAFKLFKEFRSLSSSSRKEQRQIQSNQEKQVSILGMPPYSLGTCSESEDCTVSEDTCDPCHETLFQKLKRLYCKFQRCSDTKKIVVGGTAFAGGWFVGSTVRQIGKATAIFIGTGIIVMQVASHSGYICINWGRIRRDCDKAAHMFRNCERSISENNNHLHCLMRKARHEMMKNSVISSAFVIGVLLAVS